MNSLAYDPAANSSKSTQVDGTELIRKKSSREQGSVVVTDSDLHSSTEPPFLGTTHPLPWHLRIERLINLRYPRVARFITYLKGPRPKQVLPGENPSALRCLMSNANLTILAPARPKTFLELYFLQRPTLIQCPP